MTLTSSYERYPTSPANFNQFLSGCTNLKSIHFKGRFSLDADGDAQRAFAEIPQLPKISEWNVDNFGSTYLGSLMNKNSKYIHSLTLRRFYWSHFGTISFGFANLKKLRISLYERSHGHHHHSYNQFFENTSQLQQIWIERIPRNSLVVHLVKPLLTKQRNLSFLAMRTNSPLFLAKPKSNYVIQREEHVQLRRPLNRLNINDVNSSQQCGFFNEFRKALVGLNNGHKKDTFDIILSLEKDRLQEVGIQQYVPVKIDEVVNELKLIVNILDDCDIKTWTFEFQFEKFWGLNDYENDDKDDYNLFEEALRTRIDGECYIKCSKFGLILSNKK